MPTPTSHAWAALVACALFAGCPLPGAADRQYACNDDGNCATGWRCSPDEGFCRRTCADVADCEAGQQCRNNLCTASTIPAGSSGVGMVSSSSVGSGSGPGSSGTGMSSSASSASSGGSFSSSSGQSSSSGTSGAGGFTAVITLGAGGMSNDNNLNRINLCVGQPITGFEDATVSRISLGIFSTITPEGDAP